MTVNVDIYLGEDETVDLIPYLGGREDDVANIVVVAAGSPAGVAMFAKVDSRRDVAITITPDASPVGGVGATSTSRVTITLGTGPDAEDMLIFVTATIRAATPAMVSDAVQGPVTVRLSKDDEGETILGDPKYVRVDHLFVEGKGSAGKITEYVPVSCEDDDIFAGELVFTDDADNPLVVRVAGSPDTSAITHIDQDDNANSRWRCWHRQWH